jgi:hypothetical protein
LLRNKSDYFIRTLFSVIHPSPWASCGPSQGAVKEAPTTEPIIFLWFLPQPPPQTKAKVEWGKRCDTVFGKREVSISFIKKPHSQGKVKVLRTL